MMISDCLDEQGKERRLLWRWNWYLSVHGRSTSYEAARWVCFWTGSVTGCSNAGSLDIPSVSTCRTYLILTGTLVLETGSVGILYPHKILTDFSDNIRYGLEKGTIGPSPLSPPVLGKALHRVPALVRSFRAPSQDGDLSAPSGCLSPVDA